MVEKRGVTFREEMSEDNFPGNDVTTKWRMGRTVAGKASEHDTSDPQQVFVLLKHG